MDALDKALLKAVAENNGAAAADIARPFLKNYTRNGKLRYRLNMLEAGGYIEQDRTSIKGRVFVTITNKGQEAIRKE